MQQQVKMVEVSEPVLDYTQALIRETRESSATLMGLSPRGAISLVIMAKAWAYIERRRYLLPEDLATVFPFVARHRIVLQDNLNKDHWIGQLVSTIAKI